MSSKLSLYLKTVHWCLKRKNPSLGSAEILSKDVTFGNMTFRALRLLGLQMEFLERDMSHFSPFGKYKFD